MLSSNRLEGGLSERFGELVNLRHLDVSANGLSGPLPPSMGALAKLEVLYLGESGLEVHEESEQFEEGGLELGPFIRAVKDGADRQPEREQVLGAQQFEER